MGRDAFMQLLVTQLRNQDPMDPMDAREMVTQLSELTSVEELRSIDHRLTALEIATGGMANTQVAGLVGKHVSANGAGLRLSEAGPAKGVYSLSESAKEVTITIRNEAGEEVRTIEIGAGYAGSHGFEWDGLDASGARMPPGRYAVEVSATNAEGNPVEANTEVQGLVTGISYESGYPELIVGEARLLLGDVTSIEM